MSCVSTTPQLSGEALARHVVDQFQTASCALEKLKPEVRRLEQEFKALKPGATIMGFASWKKFCPAKLGRSYRAVRYMLTGGNPASKAGAPRVKRISPRLDPGTKQLLDWLDGLINDVKAHATDCHPSVVRRATGIENLVGVFKRVNRII